MKVLQICNDYFNSSIYSVLLNRLSKENNNSFKMFVPFPKFSNEVTTRQGISREHYEEINQANVYTARCFSKFDRFFYFKKQKKIYRELDKYITEQKPELLHGLFLFSSGFLCLKAKKNHNTPYVITIQNTDVNFFFKYMPHLRKLGIEILRNSSKIIFVSNAYRDEVLRKYIPKKYYDEIYKKTEILHFGIEDFWLENINMPKSLKSDKNINLLFVGRITKNKNIISSIKVIERLLKSGYNINFTVVGNVRNKGVLNKIKKYSFVNYVGGKSREQLLDIYRENDIFIMPSKYESFGMVYVEAISQGLPIIYSKRQGFDDQFDDGVVGYRVKYNDIDEILCKIKSIIDDYETISKNCVEKCVKFDWTLVASRMDSIYNELINKNSERG